MRMKVKIIGLLLAMVSAGYAQELNESLSLRGVYEAKVRECLEKPHRLGDYSLDLWGDGASVFYMSRDPELEAFQNKDKSASAAFGINLESMHPIERCGESSFIVQKNSPKPDTLMLLYQGVTHTFYNYEPIPAQDWQPEEGDTLIADYACQKARCDFRGRQWTVWYTLDIPYSNGPWKLGGLPGLILKADDAAGDFSFTCIRISTAKEKVVLPVIRESIGNHFITEEISAPKDLQRAVKKHLETVLRTNEIPRLRRDQTDEERAAVWAKIRSQKRTACLIEDFDAPKDSAPKKKGRN